MKIKLQGRINNMIRATKRDTRHSVNVDSDEHRPTGEIGVHFSMEGVVDDDGKTRESKAVTATSQMMVRSFYADELKFGQKLYITINTEETYELGEKAPSDSSQREQTMMERYLKNELMRVRADVAKILANAQRVPDPFGTLREPLIELEANIGLALQRVT